MKMMNIQSVGLSLALHKGLPKSSQAGALVAAVLRGNLRRMGKALSSDKIVEPKRAHLIPGMEAVKKAALEARAFGCTISGAGRTATAVTDDEKMGRLIAVKMEI